MERERIGLSARLCQLGHNRSARRLTAFEWLLRLLRRGVLFGWLESWPSFRPSAGWIALLCLSVFAYGLSMLLSAGERLIKNRWMSSLRTGRSSSVADHLVGLTWRDVLLFIRVALFYRAWLLGRMTLLFLLPAMLTAFSARPVFIGGVSRTVFFGGAICLLLIWIAALFFFSAAREPLLAAVSLLTDQDSFDGRKSSLARLDKDCFQLTRFSFAWLFLSCGARFQAKAIYASIRQ